MWVITPDRELIFAPEYVGDFRMRHSILSQGGSVLSAGEATLWRGHRARAKWKGTISLQSGGYRPNVASFGVAQRVFAEYGISVEFENAHW
jgi:hypothetical protein